MVTPQIDTSDFIPSSKIRRQENIDTSDFVSSKQLRSTPNQEDNLEKKHAGILAQLGLGALSAYTWPLDVMKAGVMSADFLGNIMNADLREGGLDLAKALYSAVEKGEYIPTQSMGEKLVGDYLGYDLSPGTQGEKAARQAGMLAVLSPGGLIRKGLSTVIGIGLTQALERIGVPEGASEVAGDITGLGVGGLRRISKELPEAVVPNKYNLPFPVFMAKKKAPLLRGIITKDTREALDTALRTSSEKAMYGVLEKKRNDLLRKFLGETEKGGVSKQEMQKLYTDMKESGLHTETLENFLYDRYHSSVLGKDQPLKSEGLFSQIDSRIKSIEKTAPSLSEAQKAEIQLLNKEKEIFSKQMPSMSQVGSQLQSWNSDLKNLYKNMSSEGFSDVEKSVAEGYGFLKNHLLDEASKQGFGKEVRDLRLANEFYSESTKLQTAEKQLGRIFQSGFSVDKLNKTLRNKNGQILKRNIGENALNEIRDIADYGKKFNDILSGKHPERFFKEPLSFHELGPLAPFLYLAGSNLSSIFRGERLASFLKGTVLTRPALRHKYKLAFDGLYRKRKDIAVKKTQEIQNELEKEFGSIDNLINEALLSEE